MMWWSENYQWVVGIIGTMLLAGVVRWVLRRLFKGTLEAPRQRQEAETGSRQVQQSQAENATVIRHGRRMGWGAHREGRRADAIGAKPLKLGLGVLAGALVLFGVLYGVALLQGVPVTALPAPLVLAVAGSAVALWLLIGGVYWLGRGAMRRRASRLAVRDGVGVSGNQRSPVLSTDPTAPPAREDTLLTTSDWLALAYLVALAGYTGLLIALKELWPDTFAAWAGWSDAVPLDPLRLLGQACPAGEPATGQGIVAQLNILILPTLLAYSAYNTVEFRTRRDRMDGLNWILCLGSLVILPLLVFFGCSADWAEGLAPKYRGLVRFMLEESAGGVVYALLLVIFVNGVSYLPALVLARIFGSESNLQHRRR